MQNFEQVKDVIQYSKTIHERLRKVYASLNAQLRPERDKMLLDYLIQKQVQIAEVLANFEAVSEPSILDNWLQFTPNVDLHELLDERQPQIDMSFEEIVQLADLFSDALVEFYQEAANESELPNVRILFESLQKMAIQNNRQQDNAALFQAM